MTARLRQIRVDELAVEHDVSPQLGERSDNFREGVCERAPLPGDELDIAAVLQIGGGSRSTAIACEVRTAGHSTIQYSNGPGAFPVPIPRPADRKIGPCSYVAERHVIAERYAEYEIIGPPEVRDVDPDARYFNPARGERRMDRGAVGKGGALIPITLDSLSESVGKWLWPESQPRGK